METNQLKSPLIDAHIRVAREKKQETSKLHIWVTLLIKFSNVEIIPFNREKDLKNFETIDEEGKSIGVLNFNVHVEPIDNDSKLSETPITISKFYEFTNEIGGNADFKFDEGKNFIFLTNIITDKLITSRPEGTKRTVITYEDTDVIDDTRISS